MWQGKLVEVALYKARGKNKGERCIRHITNPFVEELHLGRENWFGLNEDERQEGRRQS